MRTDDPQRTGSRQTPHTLWELNPDTGAVIDSDVVDATSPSEIAGLGYLNGNVYLEKDTTNQILVWNPVTDTLVTTLNVAADLIGGLTGAANLGVLFDSNGAGQIFKINPSTGAVLATLSPGVGSFQGGLAYINGELIGASYSTSALLYRINPATGAVLGSYTPGGTGYLTALGGDGLWGNSESELPGGTIYLAVDNNGIPDTSEPPATIGNDDSFAFTGLPPDTSTDAQVVETGLQQTNLSSSSAGGRLFVLRSSGTSATIYELNPTNGSVIHSFAAPGTIYNLGYQGLALGANSLFYIDGGSGSAHTLWELNPNTGTVIDSDVIDATSPSPISDRKRCQVRKRSEKGVRNRFFSFFSIRQHHIRFLRLYLPSSTREILRYAQDDIWAFRISS